MKATPILVCAALVALALPAFAGRRLSDAERTTIYRDHAGAPVDSIPFLGHYNGWTPLDDHNFALWIGPSKAYMLEVFEPCMGLDYANTIRFDNRIGQLSARFDRVYVSGMGITPTGCQIKEIRPLDMKAVRAAEKEARAQSQPPKPSGT